MLQLNLSSTSLQKLASPFALKFETLQIRKIRIYFFFCSLGLSQTFLRVVCFGWTDTSFFWFFCSLQNRFQKLLLLPLVLRIVREFCNRFDSSLVRRIGTVCY